MAPASFTYVPRNEAQVDKRSNQSASKYVGIIKDEYNTFASRKDDNSIRILPPTWVDPEHYGFDVWVHFNVGPDRGQVICLSKMKHQPCSICEFQAKLEAAGREDADDFKPRRRVIVWLVERKTEAEKKTTEDNPQVWAMGWTVDRDISKICKDRETGQLYQIDHPEAGFDIFFDRSGEKEQTKYTGFALSRRESAVNPVYIEFIVKNPLPSVLLWRDYAEVKFLFEGEAVEAKDTKHAEVVPVTTVLHSATPIAPPIAMPPTNGGATYTPPVTFAAPPPPQPLPPPPAPKQFVSEWTGKNCAVCGKQTYTTPEGLTCESGHLQRVLEFPTPQTPEDALPAMPSAADRAARVADTLKGRIGTFTTGPK